MPNDKGNRSPADIERWMQQKIGEALSVPESSVDPTQPFTSYGLDSITGFTITCDLADWLGTELPAELLWEHNTIAELSQHLGNRPAD